MLIAYDLMTKDPTTISMRATVREAVGLLLTLDVRHLPVVNEEGALVGVLSDRDVRSLEFPQLVGAEYLGTIQTILDAPVASIMSSDAVSVDVEADAAEIIDLLLDHKIGAVPVVDADNTVVGIVSYMDVLRQLPIDEDGLKRQATAAATRSN